MKIRNIHVRGRSSGFGVQFSQGLHFLLLLQLSSTLLGPLGLLSRLGLSLSDFLIAQSSQYRFHEVEKKGAQRS
jgi:hypothetical protein